MTKQQITSRMKRIRDITLPYMRGATIGHEERMLLKANCTDWIDSMLCTEPVQSDTELAAALRRLRALL